MYTVINNSEIKIYKSLPYLQKIKVTSSRDSPIAQIRIKAKERGIDKSLNYNEETQKWILEFTKEETSKLNEGTSFYYLEITYHDTYEEEKPYVGRISVEASKEDVDT